MAIRLKHTIYNLEKESLKSLYDEIKKLPEREYNVYLSDHHPNKTLSQLGYLYGVVYKIIALETGYSIRDIESLMKLKFNPQEIADLDGVVTVVPGNTRDFNTKQMKEYIDEIKDWALNDLNLFIPEADKDYKSIPDELVIGTIEDGYK